MKSIIESKKSFHTSSSKVSFKVVSLFIIVALISILALSHSVSAEEQGNIFITLNDQVLSSDTTLVVQPNDSLALHSVVAPGYVIEDVKISSDSTFFQELMSYYLDFFEQNEFSANATITDETFQFPETMPGGVQDFNIQIDYFDITGKSYSENYVLHLDINDSSFKSSVLGGVLGLLSDDMAYALVDFVTGNRDSKVPDDNLLPKELHMAARDLDLANNYTVTRVFSHEVEDNLTEEDFSKLASINPEIADTLLELQKKKLSPTITKELQVFEVQTPDGSTKYITRIILHIHAGSAMKNFVVLETIPKKLSEHASDIAFNKHVSVLQDDPIVKWNLDHLPPGDSDIAYSADGKLDSLATKTIAGGSKPSVFARLFASILAKFM